MQVPVATQGQPRPNVVQEDVRHTYLNILLK